MNVISAGIAAKSTIGFKIKKWLIFAFLLVAQICHAQTTNVNWTNVHQVIDGFGANDVFLSPLTSAQQGFFFGTGSGQLGLSVLSVGVTNNGSQAGSCLTVSVSCEGYAATDIAAAASYGVRVVARPFSPPPAYTTNGSYICAAGGGNGQLAAAHYQDFANWLVNFAKSVRTYGGIPLLAMSVQNEPEFCTSNSSTLYPSASLTNFIKNNMAPTFAANGITTMIMAPDSGQYGNIGVGNSCASDSTCAADVGAVDFHDYDANTNISTDTVNDTPYPSAWPAGKKFWVLETSCGRGGPNWCNASFDPSMNNALFWAATIDQRVAVDNMNMWNYWWFVGPTTDGEGLIDSSGTVAKRAYVLGQYSRFARPGYFRIDATHKPQTGISVSAYQDTPSNTLVIVATNYTASPVAQTFNIANAPNFTSVTPYITSATQDIQAQTAQSVSGNSFTYTLPAESVTTFVGASSSSTISAPPTNLRAVVN